MKKISLFLVSLLGFAPLCLFAKSNPQDALSLLLKGNDRYLKGTSHHSSLLLESKDPKKMAAEPIAVIVGCADARVPPEIIFDQGIGDLFVVRVAGNVVGPIELDSVEFAVAKMKVPLVIVLGHQGCKAVEATLKGRKNVPELESIYPLIDSALDHCERFGQDPLTSAIDCNVQKGVSIIKSSPTIKPYVAAKKVKVIGAYYDIKEGKIRLVAE